MIEPKEVMEKIGGRKQQTLQTVLLMFIIGKLFTFTEIFAERKVWMMKVDKHIIIATSKFDELDEMQRDIEEILTNQQQEKTL